MGTDRGKGTFKVPADKAEHRLVVTYHQISKLKLNPKNPRVHSPRQIRQLARSIETFTFLVPVLVDGHGNVLAGHGRILAAQLLGWTEVPVIFVDHLRENQARAFMIADNRLTENSVWDDRLLAQQLKELSKLELDFSLEVTGFDTGEIDLRIEGLAAKTMMTIPPMPCPRKRGQPLLAPATSGS
jgi:ParB-like chromosome segregation protein Spo0J